MPSFKEQEVAHYMREAVKLRVAAVMGEDLEEHLDEIEAIIANTSDSTLRSRCAALLAGYGEHRLDQSA